MFSLLSIASYTHLEPGSIFGPEVPGEFFIVKMIFIFKKHLLLIAKLTKQSYLQSISLKNLFSQSTIYIIPFD